MTTDEWLTCSDPKAMLAFLGTSEWGSDRALRLFAVACCRRVWPSVRDERCREAIGVVERFTDGKATLADLLAARPGIEVFSRGAAPDAAAYLTAVPRYDRPSILHRYGIVDLFQPQFDAEAERRVERICTSGAWFPVDAAVAIVRRMVSDSPADGLAQAALLRDIFGPLPLRPVRLDPAWLSWNDGTAVKLAQAAYDERELPAGQLNPGRLAVLADALEQAGCSDSDLVGHLRAPGPHVRGCWAVDLILGNE